MILNIESYEQMEGPRDEVGSEGSLLLQYQINWFPFQILAFIASVQSE